eukprot:Nitzschia sp. Nitz4//scaffold149_size55946//12003//13827//NITZ4_006588-RA/size55946-exonerate_est2genome-gene-0.18-mRNA-1//1//CDS//3329536791//7623//frame0
MASVIITLSVMFPRQKDNNRTEEDVQADPCQSSRSTEQSSKRTPVPTDSTAKEEPDSASGEDLNVVRKKQRLEGKPAASASSPVCNSGGSAEPLPPVTSWDQASLGGTTNNTNGGVNNTLVQLLAQLQQQQQQPQAHTSAVGGQHLAAATPQPTQLHPPALSFVAHQEQLALAKLQLDMQNAQQGRSVADSSTRLQGQIQPVRAQPQQLAIAQQLLSNPQVLQTLLANVAHIFGVSSAAPPAPPPPPTIQAQSFQQPPMPVIRPALNLGADPHLFSTLLQPTSAATSATGNGSSSLHPLLAATATGWPPAQGSARSLPIPAPAPSLSSLFHRSASSATSPAATATATTSSPTGGESSTQVLSHSPSTLSRPPVNLTSEGKSVLLFVPKDESILSTYQCMVRKQIELFEATDDDVQFTISKMSKPVVLGQVGIRCRHCAVLPQYARPKAAVYFPRTLDSMYQFGQNMVKNHLAVPCKKIPTETQQRLIELQEERKRGRGGRERWAEGARELGVIETENGLRFTIT